MTTKKILVVEDSPTQAEIFKSALKSAGYNVIIANTGEEGLKTLESESPDLVMLDLILPGINGYEVCKKIKANPKHKHVPVVIVTIISEEEAKNKAIKTGAVDFITKPIDETALIISVAKQIKELAKKDALHKKKSPKVLIIDDEPDHVELIKLRLEANNYDVIYAYNGNEGIEKIKKEKPDLVLLDIMMPGIDGYEVSKKIKSDPKTKNLPIIMLTAAGIKDLEEKCKEAGADYCIRKPYESKEIIDTIKSILKEN